MTVVPFPISSLKRLACILKKCGHEYLPSTVPIQVYKSLTDSHGIKLLHRRFLSCARVPNPGLVNRNINACKNADSKLI